MPSESPYQGFSFTILFAFIVITLLSATVFVGLVWRWVHRRQWTAVEEWAHIRSFRVMEHARELPTPLSHLPLRARVLLTGKNTIIAQLESLEMSAPTPGVPAVQRWHVIVRSGDRPREPGALRPVNATRSFVDFFNFEEFPTLTTGVRFMVRSRDYSAGKRLAESSGRALLPPDVGLVIEGTSLILDFSTRPFDPIEFSRLISVLDQVQNAV
jgi:hypothetical protein